MHEAIEFIQSVGFPVFVATVLLWRVDRMHSENIKAIHELTIALRELRPTIIRAGQ